MSTINKAQFWQDHITSWQGSGLSQATYCKQHEIKFRKSAVSKINATGRHASFIPTGDEFTTVLVE
jgi:hypothetical protein